MINGLMNTVFHWANEVRGGGRPQLLGQGFSPVEKCDRFLRRKETFKGKNKGENKLQYQLHNTRLVFLVDFSKTKIYMFRVCNFSVSVKHEVLNPHYHLQYTWHILSVLILIV